MTCFSKYSTRCSKSAIRPPNRLIHWKRTPYQMQFIQFIQFIFVVYLVSTLDGVNKNWNQRPLKKTLHTWISLPSIGNRERLLDGMSTSMLSRCCWKPVNFSIPLTGFCFIRIWNNKNQPLGCPKPRNCWPFQNIWRPRRSAKQQMSRRIVRVMFNILVRNGHEPVRGIMNGSLNLVWNWHGSIGFDSRKCIRANNISNGWQIIFLPPFETFLVVAFRWQWRLNIESQITPSNVIVIITERPNKRRDSFNIRGDMFLIGSRSHSRND